MLNSINTILSSEGLREFIRWEAATANLRKMIRMRIFGLVEETQRRLPGVRSIRLIKEDRYGGWLKFIGLVGNEGVFKQNTVLNGEPVWLV